MFVATTGWINTPNQWKVGWGKTREEAITNAMQKGKTPNLHVGEFEENHSRDGFIGHKIGDRSLWKAIHHKCEKA